MATGRISWAEAGAAVTGRIAWSEVSSAAAGPYGRIAWVEVQPEALPAVTGRIAWAEVQEVVAVGVTGRISWSEVSEASTYALYTLTAEAGSYAVTWAGSVGQIVLDAEPAAYSMTAQEATLSVSAPPDTTAAAIWDFVLPSGLTPAQLLSELHKIHGLLPSAPLAVTSATRTAGDISQSITDSSGVVTVTRN